MMIADAHLDGRITPDHLRGRAAFTMPVQAAELAVRRALDVWEVDALRLDSWAGGRARFALDGDLHEVLAAAARALRPEGGVVFTVEAMAGGRDDFRIEGSGRYRHAAAHVEACLAAAGFGAIRVEPIVPRREAGQNVQGWLASARLAAPP